MDYPFIEGQDYYSLISIALDSPEIKCLVTFGGPRVEGSISGRSAYSRGGGPENHLPVSEMTALAVALYTSIKGVGSLCRLGRGLGVALAHFLLRRDYCSVPFLCHFHCFWYHHFSSQEKS